MEATVKQEQYDSIEEPTPCLHWHERYGYCRLVAYPPPSGIGDVSKQMSAFRLAYGYWPTIVIEGEDALALGPVLTEPKGETL